jgi:osmotically-inducible protein OsmY
MMKVMNGVALACVVALGSSLAFAANPQDESMTNDVKAKITSTTNVPATASPSVTVNTIDGDVMITGTVDTKTQKEDIEKVAKTVAGVKKVNVDHVRVVGD